MEESADIEAVPSEMSAEGMPPTEHQEHELWSPSLIQHPLQVLPLEQFPLFQTLMLNTLPRPFHLSEDKGKPGVGDIKANANIIRRTFQNFGISVEMDEVSVGPTVTRYAIKPAEGVRLSKIISLQNNLELALAAHPVRIEAPISR